MSETWLEKAIECASEHGTFHLTKVGQKKARAELAALERVVKAGRGIFEGHQDLCRYCDTEDCHNHHGEGGDCPWVEFKAAIDAAMEERP